VFAAAAAGLCNGAIVSMIQPQKVDKTKQNNGLTAAEKAREHVKWVGSPLASLMLLQAFLQRF